MGDSPGLKGADLPLQGKQAKSMISIKHTKVLIL